MRNAEWSTRHRRIARLRAREQGLTLIELIISLALLVLIVGFLAEGVHFAKRTFIADQHEQQDDESDAGIEAIAQLLASAISSKDRPALRFIGSTRSVHFTALSEGYALEGGFYHADIEPVGDRITIHLSSIGSRATAEQTVVAVKAAKQIEFRYFGRLKADTTAIWHQQWTDGEEMPELVSFRVDLPGEHIERPPIVVALRQR